MKLLLVNVAHSYSAVAVKPALELLGCGNRVSRAHTALPLILGKDVKLCNLAITGGYVTRGITLSSLKCKWNIGSRVTPLAVIYESRMITNLADLRALGLNRTQLGGSGGLNVDAVRNGASSWKPTSHSGGQGRTAHDLTSPWAWHSREVCGVRRVALTASTCHTIKGRPGCIQRQFLTSSSCSS